jgi:hypothetical protein
MSVWRWFGSPCGIDHIHFMRWRKHSSADDGIDGFSRQPL